MPCWQVAAGLPHSEVVMHACHGEPLEEELLDVELEAEDDPDEVDAPPLPASEP